ncbi:MAG: serine/threonine-protein kinase [Myxococcota bacterium]
MSRQLHDFELLARLGGSDWANVFLVRDQRIRPARLLALKVLLPSVATDASTLDVLFAEARIAARIRHPNVVNTTGFGQIEGVHCLSMEYVFGARLTDLVERLGALGRPTPLAWALRIVRAAAEGLHAAHEHRDDDGRLAGVVHRTVNPRNIRIAFDGRVKMMDFGSVMARARGFETHHGTIKGSAGYLSPEQARGEPVDRRSDVFSLGVVAWELLTGQRLFPEDMASSMARLDDLSDEPIPPPSTLRPSLPQSLDRIVLRTLAHDREQRTPTARALAEELHDLLTRAGLDPDEASVGRRACALVGPEVIEQDRALQAAMDGEDIPELAERLGANALTDADIPVIPGGMTADDPLRLFEHERGRIEPLSPLELPLTDDAELASVEQAEQHALAGLDCRADPSPAPAESRPGDGSAPDESPAGSTFRGSTFRGSIARGSIFGRSERHTVPPALVGGVILAIILSIALWLWWQG